jgi:hypothetical protein
MKRKAKSFDSNSFNLPIHEAAGVSYNDGNYKIQPHEIADVELLTNIYDQSIEYANRIASFYTIVVGWDEKMVVASICDALRIEVYFFGKIDRMFENYPE